MTEFIILVGAMSVVIIGVPLCIFALLWVLGDEDACEWIKVRLGTLILTTLIASAAVRIFGGGGDIRDAYTALTLIGATVLSYPIARYILREEHSND